MLIYLNGLLLGISLITALGPQNVFLIRQGALKNHAALSAMICFVCDTILVCASVTGLHHALKAHPAVFTFIAWFGAAFLLYYGGAALRSGLRRGEDNTIDSQQKTNRLQIILLALGFSLLNPHAIIDSLVIIGGGSAQFPDNPQAYIFGVVTASALWFISITCATRYYSNTLTRVTVWRRIELFSGALMIFLAFKLLITQL